MKGCRLLTCPGVIAMGGSRMAVWTDQGCCSCGTDGRRGAAESGLFPSRNVWATAAEAKSLHLKKPHFQFSEIGKLQSLIT